MFLFPFFHSKQRHNKLWRSHSDSDLSEHHEPLSKSYAQPHNLGRSDPHNQAGSVSGPSVKELLESLGTSGSKATHSTSQPDTGIYSSQLSSSSFKGVAAPSVCAEASRSAVARGSRQDRPYSDSTAGSVSLFAPLLSNGLADSGSRPTLPPLYQPRAATVVPESPKTDMVTVAQSVLVGQPHPPPSLHHLPHFPAPSPDPADGVIKPQVLPCSPPVAKPMLVPEPITTQTPSTKQAGPDSLSTPALVKKPDCAQQTHGSSLNSLASSPPPTSDFITYPSAIPHDNVLVFGHSADHINFFSAREKFKGMSEDGKTQCAAAQPSHQLKSCGKENQPPLQEVSTSAGKDEGKTEVNTACTNFPRQLKTYFWTFTFYSAVVSTRLSRWPPVGCVRCRHVSVSRLLLCEMLSEM